MLRDVRFVHRDQSDSRRSIWREQRIVFALSPVRRGIGLLLKRANGGHIVGSGGANQHKRQCFGAEKISASERRM